MASKKEMIVPDDLESLRSRYRIPDSVELSAPREGETLRDHHDGSICLNEWMFKAGVRIPFDFGVSKLLPLVRFRFTADHQFWASLLSRKVTLGYVTFTRKQNTKIVLNLLGKEFLQHPLAGPSPLFIQGRSEAKSMTFLIPLDWTGRRSPRIFRAFASISKSRRKSWSSVGHGDAFPKFSPRCPLNLKASEGSLLKADLSDEPPRENVLDQPEDLPLASLNAPSHPKLSVLALQVRLAKCVRLSMGHPRVWDPFGTSRIIDEEEHQRIIAAGKLPEQTRVAQRRLMPRLVALRERLEVELERRQVEGIAEGQRHFFFPLLKMSYRVNRAEALREQIEGAVLELRSVLDVTRAEQNEAHDSTEGVYLAKQDLKRALAEVITEAGYNTPGFCKIL
ncbi:hypothetical protein ACLOJK_022855 [Asimina triloba]